MIMMHFVDMRVTYVLFVLALTLHLTKAWSRPKVIVDVDVGVDDAFALSLLLSADKFMELDIVAITTVSGNTDAKNVSMNVLKVLNTAGRLDIPVFQGAEFALDTTPEYDFYFGYDGFGDFYYPDPPNSSFVQSSHGVLALLQIVSDAPGEIVLVCLGPLTNYAMAARLDPSFSENLAQVVLLGGTIQGMGNVKPGVEYNFFFDPLAAAIVFREQTKSPMLMVPWETVLINAALPLSWRVDVLGNVPGPMMTMLNAAEEKVMQTYKDVWNCGDLLAAAVLVNPDLITLADLQHIDVEVHAASLAGATLVDYAKTTQKEPNVLIVKDINVELFQEMLLQYLES